MRAYRGLGGSTRRLHHMYFITLFESLHCNKEGFISSAEDIIKNLKVHLDNWDCEYSEKELQSILKNGRGYANEQSKSCVEVTIVEVQPGESIYLE